VVRSPDSRELADYEEYCRRELPRLFRASLEEVVNNNTQPLEEQLRSQLTELIRDAQDQVFSSYRSSSAAIPETPSRRIQNPSSQEANVPAIVQGTRNNDDPETSSIEDHLQLPAFFEPPAPQNQLQSSFTISELRTALPHTHGSDSSDSGYGSSNLSFLSPIDPTTIISTIHAAPWNSQNLSSMDNQSHENSSADELTTPGGSIGHLQNTFDFNFDPNSIDSNFDMDSFERLNFSTDFPESIGSFLGASSL
jgi:hypothetical protein